ncbi:Glucoside xylosyltransferase 1-like 2 [Homarus americanus]|uniref:Glucoside xylosyltransferase 1-like 2 n=2 Tax=Homarus americanus TaxID=6706 RepID=A0A8J5JFG8_HOMAM|nr:Glucoside xylosyltransferase 1-like 2 [Homarus americanus]
MEVPLVMVVCDGKGVNGSDGRPMELALSGVGSEMLRGSWERQAEQVTTLLKTLLYFSSCSHWRVIVLTDTFDTYLKVVKIMDAFPSRHRRRLLLQYRDVWLPSGYGNLKDHWRTCVWAKQFLAEALPQEDAVVYVDTDLVFLGPAEQLSWLLRSMDDQQVVALAPEPQYLVEEPKYPSAGRVGLNTGVMAVNLTRLRRLPGGGLGSAILKEGSFVPAPRHDQDAVNHYLANKPHLLQEVTARWNFLPSSCFTEAPPCPDCVSEGILLLHGADATFFRHVDRKYLVIYSLLASLQLLDDPRSLLAKAVASLASTDAWYDYPCSNYTNINHALTLGMINATKLYH